MTPTIVSGRPRFPLARFLQAFWLLFALAWATAVLAFPLVKDIPAGYLAVLLGSAIGLSTLRSGGIWRLSARVDTWSSPRFVQSLIGITVALRTVAVLYFPIEPMVDDAQFHRYAVSMVSGGGYGAPSHLAWFPPGMSLALTAWYFVTVPTPLSGKLLHVLIAALLSWQTWALARDILPERTARLAALLVAVFPTLVLYTATLGYETLLGLIFVSACRLSARVESAPITSRWLLIGLGGLVGLGALVKPICLLLPLFLGASWWLLGSHPGRALRQTAVVAIVMLAVISPWTARNYRVLGEFVLISTNGGYTLYAANNPRATGLAMAVAPVAGERGEVSTDRVRTRAALSWIAANPGEWLRLALRKVTYTWGTSSSIMSVVSTDRLPPTVESAWKFGLNVAWSALLVLCIAAIPTSREWVGGLLAATLVIAYVFGLHLFFEAHSRHHVPVVPFLCIVGAAGFSSVHCRQELPPEPVRS